MVVVSVDLRILETVFHFVSSRLREAGGKKRIDRTDQNNAGPHLLQSQPTLSVLLSKPVGCPSTESYTAASPDPGSLTEWGKHDK